MQKAKKFDIEDSNIELIGSQEDKDARKKASEGEPAWQEPYPGEGNAMKQPGRAVGEWIWRIEKFKVVSWPREQYGNFYTGDSYIMLKSVQNVDPETGEPLPKLSHDIHFWIGSESSQDEYGTAAYKTVELDDYINYHFGSDPVQHREVEGYESSEFLSFFPKGIKFMKGGVDTGFRKVEAKTYKNKLLHVKGKKNAVVREVDLSVSAMNSGDIFILDAGLKLYQWNGKESGLMEKAKAAEYVNELESERGNAETEVYDEGQQEPSSVFWEILGGKAPIPAAIPEPEDMAYDCKMFKVSDATGKLEMTEVKFEKSSLDTNDVFVVDFGLEVYVWVGKGASDNERANGLGYATKYLKDHGRPMATSITSIKEESFSAGFSKAFANAAANLSFDKWDLYTTDGKLEKSGVGLADLKNALPADESRFCIYHYDKDLIRLQWKGPSMPGMAKIKSNQALDEFKKQHVGCKITVEVLGTKNLTRAAIAGCLAPGSGLDVIDD